SRRDLQSLMLQNVAVINHGEAPFKIDHIEIELLQSGEVLDSKKLNGNVIHRFAERGAKMQEAGVLEQIAFQFCGNDLIAPSVKLAGPTLNRDQALLVTQQVFAFRDVRDTLRIHVHGNGGSGATEISGTLPIKSEFARLHKDQGTLQAKGANVIAGNYVKIDHGKDEYSFYAHLQPGGVRVHVGDHVKAGDVIGKLGSSGNSTEPHLHFHVCDAPDVLLCAGIPVNFSNITIQWADLPRPIQSGDIIIAK